MSTARTPLPVTLREARFDDFIAIESVQARNGLVAKNHEEWQHLWIDNPLYRKLAHWHIGWVAESEDGKIVGYVGHVPLSYEFKGRQIVAACAHGLVIDSSHRGNGVYLLKCHLSDKYTDVVLTSTANPNSGRHLDVLCSRVPTGNWSEAAFWITSHHGFAESILRRRRWPEWLSWPASAALALRDRASKPRIWRPKEDKSEIQVCSGFDERFDTFWEALKQAYPDRLLATRSREFLQWHFKYALARNEVWIVTAGAPRISAYAIFCRQDNRAIGLKRVRLIDFQALSPDSELLIPMLAWAFRRCQGEGIHMLEAFGFRPEKQQWIDSLRPYRRLAFWSYFYRARDKTLGRQLEDPAVWDPTHFDADSTL